jgi:uncharacterized membrane protein
VVFTADVVSEDAADSGVTALEAEVVSASAVVCVFSVEVTAAVVAAVVAVVVTAVVVFVSAVAIVSVTTDVADVAELPPQPVEHTSAINKIIDIKNLLLCIPI